jgi:hypothetical protein
MNTIETMTTSQWITYRANLLANHYAKGLDLKPTLECTLCDSINDYVCFACELTQIESE